MSDNREAFSEHIRCVHEKVKAALKANDEAYGSTTNQHRRAKDFEKGDIMLVYLR